MNAKTLKNLLDCLEDNIMKIKTEIDDPYLVIAGDLNKKDIPGWAHKRGHFFSHTIYAIKYG